jgi:type IV pilus assembly protein PilE
VISKRSAAAGFSLVELMITVAIIAILAGIGYPSYTAYMKRGYRSQAQQLMAEIQSREVQYLLDARQYTATIGAGGLNISNKDGWTCTTTCTNGKYTVAVTLQAGPPPGFMVSATPTGNQVSDGTIYLNADQNGVYADGRKARSTGDFKW